MHNANMICGSIHYGNIFLENNVAIIGDLSMAEILDDDSSNKDVIYGIIPYIAQEIIQVPRYTKVSDIHLHPPSIFKYKLCQIVDEF
ncbi:hypothetical protein C1645_839643 [Glomus cerebriforme]|uniref:Protein kinase domain-containing protein n=1 Tax=Glomus cerebriforme TaxID=658196 RepID=A0A397S6F5_9GLOM|nr:hypothetical protein C1645_839643 [Glomus cerebriforme]